MHNVIKSLKNSSIHVMIPGQSGLLEGKLITQKNEASIALILPPHPKHKGTMNNKIVNLLYKLFADAGFHTLKINYRGVGESQGSSEGNECEINDALTSLDWLVSKFDKNKTKNAKIYLAGFSFGGWIALQCAMRRPEISNFISIATTFNAYATNMLTPCPNGLIVNAINDHTIDFKTAEDFCSKLIVQPNCNLHIEKLETDHYITNKLPQLETLVKNYIK